MNLLERSGTQASLKRVFQYRHLEYFLFIAVIVWKLGYMHSHLHANNIDMSRLDYVIAIGSIMAASFWTLWLPRRGRGIALSILNLLITALIFSDLVYYRYFQDFITIPVLLQAGQVGELGGSIRELIHWTDIWFFIDWIFYIPMIFVLASRKRRSTIYNREATMGGSRLTRITRRLITGIVTLGLGLALTLGPIHYYTSTWAVGLFAGNWWNMALYNVTGLLGFHYYDAYKYGLEHWGPKKQLSDQELADIKMWYDKASSDRPVMNETYGAYKGSNVMVIQAEAFMNFMIGKQVNGQEITPNFNKLMKESLYYSNYYHQTGQGRTSDADFSSHSSLHPLPTGSVFTRYPDHQYDVLPQILKSGGYTTAAFHAYDSSFWNRYTMYKNMGYDHFYSKKDYVIDEPLGWSLGDKSFFKQSLGFMDKEKQPFYSYLVTLSSHHPYSLPQPVQQLDVGEFSGTIFGDYLEAIHYTDAALGQLVDQMKAEGLWDKTILYFYGDHDNSIKDKSYYEKFLGKSLTDLDMEQIMNQVPLLVHLPDGKHAGVYNEPAGQLDMTPSLMHLLGISSKPYYMMGNDIFDDRKKMVVLRSGAFTDGTIYYIPSADGVFENGTCYDLSTRQKTEVERARQGYEEAKKQLDYSDKTIMYDLIQKFEEAVPQGH
ncbi:Lipoteichoic acid synthase 2 [compost metagenome]